MEFISETITIIVSIYDMMSCVQAASTSKMLSIFFLCCQKYRGIIVSLCPPVTECEAYIIGKERNIRNK